MTDRGRPPAGRTPVWCLLRDRVTNTICRVRNWRGRCWILDAVCYQQNQPTSTLPAPGRQGRIVNKQTVVVVVVVFGIVYPSQRAHRKATQIRMPAAVGSRELQVGPCSASTKYDESYSPYTIITLLWRLESVPTRGAHTICRCVSATSPQHSPLPPKQLYEGNSHTHLPKRLQQLYRYPVSLCDRSPHSHHPRRRPQGRPSFLQERARETKSSYCMTSVSH